MIKNVSVIGAGSFGMALAMVLADNGHNVKLWSFDEKSAKELSQTRCNEKYLENFKLSESIKVTSDKKEAIIDSEIIIMVVPSKFVRENLLWIKEYSNENQIFVSVAKGFDTEKDIRISQVIEEILPNNKFAVLSGPSHAEELTKKMATAVVVASSKSEIAHIVQDIFMNDYFRLYTSHDIIGVELGGALKNVIAIGVGILEGAGLGDNAKAALMTRGNAEIIKLGVAMGAKHITFAGLSGMGDLIVTCASQHSRNRRAGIMLGQGKTLEETLKTIGMVVEGVTTAKTAYKLVKENNMNLPITEEVYKVIFEGKDPQISLTELMTRAKKAEFYF